MGFRQPTKNPPSEGGRCAAWQDDIKRLAADKSPSHPSTSPTSPTFWPNQGHHIPIVTSHPYCKRIAHARVLFGVENALWAKNYVRKPKKSSMDGHAEAEPCTRERAWLDFATSMDGLAQVHGWTSRSAWFRFRRCMDGLKNRDLRNKMSRLIDRRVSEIHRLRFEF